MAEGRCWWPFPFLLSSEDVWHVLFLEITMPSPTLLATAHLQPSSMLDGQLHKSLICKFPSCVPYHDVSISLKESN